MRRPGTSIALEMSSRSGGGALGRGASMGIAVLRLPGRSSGTGPTVLRSGGPGGGRARVGPPGSAAQVPSGTGRRGPVRPCSVPVVGAEDVVASGIG
jgi:hypothetical protein